MKKELASGESSQPIFDNIHYKTLIESLPHKVFLKDAHSTYIACNENFAHDLHITPDEIAGKTDFDFFPPELAEKYQKDDEKIMETGEVLNIEELYIQNEKEQYVNTIKTPLLDKKSNSIGILGIFQDITQQIQDRKVFKDQLAFERNQFLSILENFTDSVYVVDPQTYRILFTNKTLQEKFGKDLTGGICYKEFQGLDAPCEFCTNHIILSQKGIPYQWEYHNPVLDRDFLITDILIDWPDGQEVRLEFATDITTQKETVRSLQETRKLVEEYQTRFTRLFEEAHDAILLFDVEGQFLDMNRKAIELFGYTKDELTSMTIWDLISPSEQSDSHMKLKKLLDGDRIPVFERTLVAKDGSLIPVENSAFVVRDEHGEVKFIQSILRDIRKRKEAERRVQQTLEEVERSNRELEQFAYVASHDLQEPLRMVASFTQLLEKRYADQLDDTAREYIAFAVDGANRMQNLINALLRYSRVGTRGNPFTPTDCSEVLAQALINVKSQIDETQALITNDALPIVAVDADQLVQLFQNLISNAIKFRKDTAPRIHISAECTEDEAIFSVSDNGIGIDPTYLDKIFVIFQRLDGHAFPGTGIGLSICKKIVERHEGRIWVESEPGHGSTFYFTLPHKEVNYNE